MDQSSSMFEQPKNGKVLLFCLPTIFLVLNNEYKGENITNLTVEPGLVPFDTFDVLVKNNFDIRSQMSLMDVESYSCLKKNTELASDSVLENAHEAFPIISEFWDAILLRFPYNELKSLAALKHRISHTSWFYLNHSKMLAAWKWENGRQGSVEDIERILSIHMDKCSKSAMIMPESMAMQLFSILEAANKPAFYGKDIINENVVGYNYRGYFLKLVLQRIKNSFTSGIIIWWQKYLK